MGLVVGVLSVNAIPYAAAEAVYSCCAASLSPFQSSGKMKTSVTVTRRASAVCSWSVTHAKVDAQQPMLLDVTLTGVIHVIRGSWGDSYGSTLTGHRRLLR